MAETKKIINNPSITTNDFEYDEVGRVSAISGHPLAGEGGGTIVKSDLMWKPTVASDGYVHWTLASSATEPEAAYISGAQGPAGQDGTNGTNGKDGKDGISLSATSIELDQQRKTQVQIGQVNGPVQTTFELPWGQNGVSPTVSTSAIPGGNRVIFTYDNDGTTATESIDVMSGVSGANGSDGFSPTVVTAAIPVSEQFPAGGTKVTITDGDGQHIFNISNGLDGQGATVNLLGGEGIEVTKVASNYTISVSADYAAKSYVDSASANALSQAESWVETEGYLKSVSVATNGSIDGTGTTNNPLSLKTSAENALAAVGGKLNIPPSLTANTYYVLHCDNNTALNWEDSYDYMWNIVPEITEAAGLINANYTWAENGLSGHFDKNAYEYHFGIATTNMSANKQYAFTTTGWAEVQAGASFTGVTTTGSISGGGVNNDTIGLLTSAENALTAVGNKVDKPSTTLNNKYLVLRTNNDGSVSGWVDFNDNVYSKTEADGRYVATADVGTGLYYSGSTPKLGVNWSALSGNLINSAKSANSAEYITNGTGYSGFNDISAKFGTLSSYVPYSATVLPIGTNNTATNNSIAIGASNTANDLGFAVGQANTALKRSIAFGVNNYANDISLAIGYNNSASGNNDNNQSAVNIAIGYANSAADHAAAFINVCTAQNYAFAAGHANSAIDNAVAFGRNTSAYFYSFDFGHSNYVKNYSYAFGRGLSYEGQWASGSQYGAFVIGGWNATTSYATTADAPLFIVGNGSNNNPSDGFIVYRDGDVTAAGKISANGMFAVSTEATLFGQSRIANVGDTTALGTNWLGVTQSHQGFLKYVNGGNVGELNGTSIQINFAPDGANSYGNITVNSQNNESKIINVPTASYNNMTTFDPTNGPNYMLRKTASGFDIGAKVVNVTAMPQNLDANTYYFVYEV